MDTRMTDVICMGEVLVEIVAQNVNVPLHEVETYKAAAGGAPANVAVGIQQLGLYSTAFCGSVGAKDPFGAKLQQKLLDQGVNATSLWCRDEDHPTSLVFTAVWQDGRKELCFYRGADAHLIRNNLIGLHDMLSEARCLHYGSITFISQPGADTQREILERARSVNARREKKLMISYDPNYRPTLWPNESTARRVIFEAFQYAHLVKISQEEFEVATGHEDLERGIQAVLDQSVELVVITLGANGALAVTKTGTRVESPALADIDIKETTGAGDAFVAAMITRMIPEFEKRGGSLKNVDRETLKDALDYANVVAGLTCTEVGAIPALPNSQAVDKFLLRRNKPHDSSRLSLPAKEMASMIDHTFLKPNCTQPNDDDIETLCREASTYGFAMVAVNPAQVEKCCGLLRGTNVKVGATIGFPLGQTTSEVKTFETQNALEKGATEIDMVLNIRELQRANFEYVQCEIESVVQTCREFSGDTGTQILCKVILETCYLTTEQKIKACKMCLNAGADFVKTSTGFGPSGATIEDIKLMRQVVVDNIGVKASGGIHDLATARKMIDAGATRIGTSKGVAIMEELLEEE